MEREGKTVVSQYRVRVALPDRSGNVLCEMTSDQLEPLKERVNRLLNGGAVFEPAEGNAGARLQLIYHPHVEHGKISIGHIATFECPEEESVGAVIDRRLAA